MSFLNTTSEDFLFIFDLNVILVALLSKWHCLASPPGEHMIKLRTRRSPQFCVKKLDDLRLTEKAFATD